MNNQLTFKNQTIIPVIVNNLPYLRVPQIEDALNYRCGKLLQIYNRHADEFTPEMSFLTTIDTKGGKQQVRVFSLRGCHLLAMFSKTPVAKEFRKWVLDLIEQHNQVISKMETPTVDMRAIGGLVKKCTAVAIRDELKDVLGREVKEVIKDQFIKFSLSTFACAEDLKPFQQVTDDMLLRGLYDWYSTRHHKLLDTVKELDEENGKLKSKIATIKKTVN